MMTVKECYSMLHGDYEEARLRFKTDDRIQKFLFMFLNDEHYKGLCDAMEEENYEEAFLNVHTLKGVCANLALSALFEETETLTELLREGKCNNAVLESFDKVKEVYVLTRKAVEELKNDE